MVRESLQFTSRIAPLIFLVSTGCLSTLVAGYEDGGPHSSSTNASGSSGSSSGTVGTSSGQGSSSAAASSSGATGSGIGGGTSTGGTSSGGTSSGGSGTGPDLCLGVYCAPAFACDPSDGICKCDGHLCSGNCDADSGACLAACDSDGGPYPVIGQSPDAVRMTRATLGHTYVYTLQAACGVPPITWQLVSYDPAESFEPIGLALYTIQGLVEGVPNVVSDGGPFEFEIEAMDSADNTGVQNYLLDVVAGP